MTTNDGGTSALPAQQPRNPLHGVTLEAMALNDYKTTIPMDDAQQFDVIVAHRINDQPISVRTKGPLFIIYPFDSKPELKSSKYYGRSAWQLKSIKVD